MSVNGAASSISVNYKRSLPQYGLKIIHNLRSFVTAIVEKISFRLIQLSQSESELLSFIDITIVIK